MAGRILRAVDFERALATPARARSAHFSAHHVPAAPARWVPKTRLAASAQLSTGDSEVCAQPVDDSPASAPTGWWFGVVVPKRHAREATTRNLIKRQIRAALRQHEAKLARGLWLVRLRAGIDRRRFVSSTSAPLREDARRELDELLRRAAP